MAYAGSYSLIGAITAAVMALFTASAARAASFIEFVEYALNWAAHVEWVPSPTASLDADRIRHELTAVDTDRSSLPFKAFIDRALSHMRWTGDGFGPVASQPV